jgi:hypothetical protein
VAADVVDVHVKFFCSACFDLASLIFFF